MDAIWGWLNTPWGAAMTTALLSGLLLFFLQRLAEHRARRRRLLQQAHIQMMDVRWTVRPDPQDGDPVDQAADYDKELTHRMKMTFEQVRPLLSETSRRDVDSALGSVRSKKSDLEKALVRKPPSMTSVNKAQMAVYTARKEYREAMERVVREEYRGAIAPDANHPIRSFPGMPWLRRLLRRPR